MIKELYDLKMLILREKGISDCLKKELAEKIFKISNELTLIDVNHQRELLKTTRERNIFNDGYSLGCKTTRKKYDK